MASGVGGGKRLALAAALLIAPSLASAQRFDFRPGTPGPGSIHVAPDAVFSAGRFGYEPRGAGTLFSVAVAEGTYRVTVTLGDAGRATHTTIKAESRRLMLLDVATRRGEFVSRSFLVPVRTPALAPPPANAPGAASVRLASGESDWYDWDDRLTLEVLGPAPGLAAVTIEPATAPTIHLAGDSTVADQPYEPVASWGQMLPALLDGTVAIANHAHSGETLKSFLTSLRLDKLLAGVKPGDWVLIQFGHNDQKTGWPQTYADAAGVYPAYLKAYVAEVRRRGAEPVLITSPQRLNYDASGRIVGSLDYYSAAVRAVGAQEHVPVIDLNAATRTIYEALGPTQAARGFNDGGRDRTHNDNYGAWLLANAVAAALAVEVPELAAHVGRRARAFDPARPPGPTAVIIPASLARDPTRPAGN